MKKKTHLTSIYYGTLLVLAVLLVMNTSCKRNNNIDTASYIESADGFEHESEEEIAYEM